MRTSIPGRALLLSALILAGAAGWAQQKPESVSTDLGITFAAERSQVVPNDCCFWFKGGGADASFNFWKGWGIAATLTGDHAANVTSGVFVTAPDFRLRPQADAEAITDGVDVNKISFLAGPRYTWTAWTGARDHRLQVFGQGLFGISHGFDGLYPSGNSLKSSANSFAIQTGGGLNYYFTRHWGVRLIEADYVRTAFPNAADDVQNDLRLAAGVTYHIGGAAPAPVTLACSANPSQVFPGDPVSVTATAGGLDPKLNTVYSFSGEGATGNGSTASIATASLAPGVYTVKCGVKEGKPGKEGLKPWESANASTSFTVKAFEPPTTGCSANPSTIKPGETSTVTAAGMSPQNRPLTYSYSAAAGTVSGDGATATFNSTGAPTGTTSITCTVTDDKGQTATAQTTVSVLAPPPPPPSPEQVRLETRLALHSIFFPTAQPTTVHPEGGLVDSQQGTLTTLATDFKSYLAFKPQAHLTLTGHTDVRGSVEYNQALSERRVARAKQFLVEQGVPEASIETRGLGKDQELTADQVQDLVNQNTELSAPDRDKMLKKLAVIVLAQNRRVDVILSTTGQESVRLYPFNAADSLTLLDMKASASHKKAAQKKSAVPETK
jgi:outer membrane protein OmpA-like peptidoglycan-associated protein